MKTWKGYLSRKAIVLFAIAFVGGAAHADEIDINGQKVQLLAPEGYVRIDGVHRMFDTFSKNSLPPSNRLLGSYGTREDLKVVASGGIPEQARGFNVQWLRIDFDYDQELFGGFVRLIEKDLAEGMELGREGIKDVVDRSSDVATELLDEDVTLELGKTIPLGVIGKGENWISYAIIIPIKAEGRGEKVNTVLTCVSTKVLIGNRLLSVTGANNGMGKKAFEELKTDMENWRLALFEANK